MRFALLLVLLLLAVALAGCGGAEATTVSVTRSVEVTTTVRVTTTVASETTEPGADAALDPDDVDGPLDVRDVTARRRGDLLTTTVVMYEPWESSVLGGMDVTEPGTERLAILYDVDFDQKVDYRGAMVFVGGVASLFIAGSGQAFEPVEVERLDEATVIVTHPVDVFFVEAGETDLDAERDIQVAVVTAVAGERDRAPNSGWIAVSYAP